MGAQFTDELAGGADELAGRIDGETAAITGLGALRALAITTMAEAHNQAYADAYWAGYLNALTVITTDFSKALTSELNSYCTDNHQGALAA